MLEGGYNLRSISRSMEACARALLGEERVLPTGETTPRKQDMDAITEAIGIHSKFWSSLRRPSNNETAGAEEDGFCITMVE